MTWFYIFIIAAALLIGYLYWDKCRELKIARGEIDPNLPAASVFFYNVDDEQLAEEANGMKAPLIERGFELLFEKKHTWGYEMHFVLNTPAGPSPWVVYVIDSRCEHPTFAAKIACFDSSLTVVQTIDEVQQLADGTTVYAKGENEDELYEN